MIQPDQRRLGASDIIIPASGIGTAHWGDREVSQHRTDLYQAYSTALDNGINFFDTAEIYGNGAAERVLGECISKDERSVIIASKFSPVTRLSADSLLRSLDASRERLNIQTIDLYMIHFPYTLMSLDKLIDALAQAVRSGKVRAVGVSNFNAARMRPAHARLARHDIPLAANEVHYSLLHRQPETNGVLDACRELNVALIAYWPIEQGLLTGKYRGSNGNSATGFWRFRPTLRPAMQRKFEPLLQTMETIARSHDKTIGQVALNWLHARDEHVIPIVGAKNARQAHENAGAIGWQLTGEEFAQIDQASRPFS